MYQIILNEQRLLNFIDWLPDLEDSEVYYCSLFARKKYCQDLPNNKHDSTLSRFCCKKEHLLERIKRLEITTPYYFKGVEVPQQALALYINPNPRCLEKASFMLLRELATKLSRKERVNPKSLAMTCIHKSKSRAFVVAFDIDEAENIDKAREICDNILLTRGGAHVLVEPSKMPDNNWYQKLAPLADNAGDMMIPIAGTSQGNFCPRFENENPL